MYSKEINMWRLKRKLHFAHLTNEQIEKVLLIENKLVEGMRKGKDTEDMRLSVLCLTRTERTALRANLLLRRKHKHYAYLDDIVAGGMDYRTLSQLSDRQLFMETGSTPVPLIDARKKELDCVVNTLADGVTYSYEELDYIYQQLSELKSRGHF